MKNDMLIIYDKVFSNLQRLKNYIIKFIDDNPDFDSQILHLSNQVNRRNNNNDDDGDGENGENNNNDDDSDNDNKGNGKRKRINRKKNNKKKGNKNNYKYSSSNNLINNLDIEQNNNNNNNNNNIDLSKNGFIRYCPICNNPMRLQQNRSNGCYFIGCTK